MNSNENDEQFYAAEERFFSENLQGSRYNPMIDLVLVQREYQKLKQQSKRTTEGVRFINPLAALQMRYDNSGVKGSLTIYHRVEKADPNSICIKFPGSVVSVNEKGESAVRDVVSYPRDKFHQSVQQVEDLIEMVSVVMEDGSQKGNPAPAENDRDAINYQNLPHLLQWLAEYQELLQNIERKANEAAPLAVQEVDLPVPEAAESEPAEDEPDTRPKGVFKSTILHRGNILDEDHQPFQAIQALNFFNLGLDERLDVSEIIKLMRFITSTYTGEIHTRRLLIQCQFDQENPDLMVFSIRDIKHIMSKATLLKLEAQMEAITGKIRQALGARTPEEINQVGEKVFGSLQRLQLWLRPLYSKVHAINTMSSPDVRVEKKEKGKGKRSVAFKEEDEIQETLLFSKAPFESEEIITPPLEEPGGANKPPGSIPGYKK